MKISTGAGAVILAMCAGAASASGAAAAEHPAAADRVSPAVAALDSQVRAVPDQVSDIVQMPNTVRTPPPRLSGKAGDQRLDFGPFGMLSAQDTQPGAMATGVLGGALRRVSHAIPD